MRSGSGLRARAGRRAPVGKAAVAALVLVASCAGRGGSAGAEAPATAAPEAAWARLDSLLALQPLGEGDSLRVTPIGSGRHGSALLIQLAAGARVPGHVHREHDEFVHVIRGSGWMRAGGGRLELRPGMLVVVPQGTPHGARAGLAGCAVVSTYAPLWDPADRHHDTRGDP